MSKHFLSCTTILAVYQELCQRLFLTKYEIILTYGNKLASQIPKTCGPIIRGKTEVAIEPYKTSSSNKNHKL